MDAARKGALGTALKSGLCEICVRCRLAPLVGHPHLSAAIYIAYCIFNYFNPNRGREERRHVRGGRAARHRPNA